MADNERSPSGHDLLIFLPTYYESGNVAEIIRRIRALDLATDILFIDDNSPDGTGALLDRLAQQEAGITVIHRKARSGIGSAHREALLYAYEKKYALLITMDADLTHDPGDIPRFLERAGTADVVVGSRFMTGATDRRKCRERLASRFSHLATSFILGLPYDVTNAFRLYRLDAIDPAVFNRIQSGGYAFFVESLYVLRTHGAAIMEIPVRLSNRLSGKSKMSCGDFRRWITRVISLRWAKGVGQGQPTGTTGE